MLSRKTRQQVVELLETVDAGLVRFSSATEKAAMLEDCIAAFSAAQDICHEALSTARLAFYRETLDTLSAALEQLPVAGDSADIASLCHSLLGWLLDALREEPVKKEIVFLPYKASMWDSLESIWQAAVNDAEHCNAYVIPIPYADLTPEHTAKEWHVEKELFPDYVPVIDFRSVDLEKLHPDVIFIHNPYDWANHVTSVDARYYSEQLKKYTDKLVYVPYFNAGDSATEGVCQAPGIVNADYVIVESDPIRNQYEYYYPGGNPPSGKFLSLGSPKYDKVQKGTKAEYPLPKSWRRLVEKKKIILYNTSVNAALQYSDKINAKLRYVFDFFRQRDDVVLWWRPHPLLKATLDAMRPEYAREYRQLEEQYQKEAWGIYDDTPDVTRAVIWADGYYGDNSSVAYLYQATGKPILMEHLPFLEDPVYNRWFPMAAVDEERIFFAASATLFSGLYQLEKKTDTLTLLAELPIPYSRQTEYAAIGKIGTKVILMPFYCHEGALEYDLIQRAFRTIPLPMETWREGSDVEAFTNVFRYGDSLYFIGNGNGLIVEYDSIKGQYFFHTSWAENLPVGKNALRFFLNAGGQVAGHAYLPVMGTNQILALELTTGKAALHVLPVSFQALSLSYDPNREDFWVTPLQGNQVVCWNRKENHVQTYLLPIPSDTVMGFANSISIGGRQIFFPFLRSEFFSLSKEDGKVQREYEWEKRYDTVLHDDNCWAVEQADTPFGIGLAYMYRDRSLLEIDSRNNLVKRHQMRFSWEEDFDCYKHSQAQAANAIHFERYGMSLRELLLLIEQIDPVPLPERGEAGQRIYDWLQCDAKQMG